MLAQLSLRGRKITKKQLIGNLIENAYTMEGIGTREIGVVEEDPAWIGLEITFDLGIADLSENVDEYLYKMDGD